MSEVYSNQKEWIGSHYDGESYRDFMFKVHPSLEVTNIDLTRTYLKACDERVHPISSHVVIRE